MLSHQGVVLFEKIRRYGLGGGCVGVGFDISKACARPSLTLPVDQDIELSAPCPISHLPTYYHMLPAMTRAGTVSQPPIKCFYNTCLGYGVSSQQ